MTLHVARWDKFTYAGQDLDRGQIVELQGMVNDEKLLRLGYISKVQEKSPRILECGECGAKFLDDSARLAHGRRRHPHRERMPEMAPGPVYDPTSGEPSVWVDTEGDKEDREREQNTPLYLENTTASRS
jgi:hypothetical protein